MTVTDEHYKATATVQLTHADGTTSTITVVAEPTDTPGLVVIPKLSDTGFSGDWILTHAASGRQIPVGAFHEDLWTVRRVAKELGTTSVDWTADVDTIAEQMKEHGEAVRDARAAGFYPKPEPDDGDDEPGDGPAPYPRTEAQATSDALARHLTASGQQRCAEGRNLLTRKDDDGRRIYVEHMSALIAEFGLVWALRALARIDQRAADHAAREIWGAWEDGSTVHEFLYEWANEYGLPLVDDDSEAKS